MIYFQDDALFETEMNISAEQISKYARPTYDAIWAMALSLRDVHNITEKGHFKKFNYKRNDMVLEFVRRMSSLNFMGISVNVYFRPETVIK